MKKVRQKATVGTSCLLLAVFGLAACGGDTLGVATTVVNVTPTNFATIPPVAATAPGSTTTLPSNAVGAEQIYTIVAGDSPIAVANKFGISLSTLLAYNAMVSAAQFPYPGSILRIPPQAVANPDTGTQAPVPGATPGVAVGPGCGTRPAGTYSIQKNDSFFAIEKKFCITRGALLSANNWQDPSVMLLVGMIINIPAANS